MGRGIKGEVSRFQATPGPATSISTAHSSSSAHILNPPDDRNCSVSRSSLNRSSRLTWKGWKPERK
jgi:hypothetical protein